MRRSIIFNALIIGVLVVSTANAFVKGENRIGNSNFEADKTGELPVNWSLRSGG